MKRIILLLLFVSLLCTFIFSFNKNTIQTKDDSVPTLNLEKRIRENDLDASYDYLMSYDKAYFYDDEDTILYSSIKSINSENAKYCKFEITYIKQIDIIFVDLSYLDDYEVVLKDYNAYAYPFLNEDDELDIELDLFGQVFIYSEYITPPKRNGPTKRNHIIPPDLGGYDPLYDILSITNCISQFGSAVGLAYSFVVVPDILTLGPLPYLFYQLKLEMAQNNYLNNIAQPQPINYIYNQSNYSNWQFGINLGNLSANVADAGCECIAIYNMLYGCSRPTNVAPHLPSIIALVQLCNADLLCGNFGALSIPNEIADLYLASFISYFEDELDSTLALLISDMCDAIIDIYSNVSGWLDIFLPDLSNLLINTINIALTTLLGGSPATGFLGWITGHQHDIGDVISLVIGNHSYNSHGTLTNFRGDISVKAQGIVSFWNRVNSDGSIDYESELHTVYVLHNYLTDKFDYFNIRYYTDYGQNQYVGSNGPVRCNTVNSGIERGIPINNCRAHVLFAWGYVMVQ